MGGGLNSRAYSGLGILVQVRDLAKELDVVCFCGDFWDTRGSLPVALFNIAYGLVAEIAEHCPFLFIRGNHDLATQEEDSPSSIDSFVNIPRVCILDKDNHYYLNPDLEIWGLGADEPLVVPKGTYKGSKVFLLLHTLLKGAKIHDKYNVEEGLKPRDLKSFMKDNNVEFCAIGDIHLRQTVSDNIVYVGSCIQKSFADTGQEKGMIFIDTALNGWKFVPLDSPKFVEIGYDNGDGNWWNNYDYFRVSTRDQNRYEDLMQAFENPGNVQLMPPEKVAAKCRSDITLDISHEEAMRRYVEKEIEKPEDQARLYKYGMGFLN
jgi:DNA repair exonuclease SbcCD nuclease subunit